MEKGIEFRFLEHRPPKARKPWNEILCQSLSSISTVLRVARNSELRVAQRPRREKLFELRSRFNTFLSTTHQKQTSSPKWWFFMVIYHMVESI